MGVFEDKRGGWLDQVFTVLIMLDQPIIMRQVSYSRPFILLGQFSVSSTKFEHFKIS